MSHARRHLTVAQLADLEGLTEPELIALCRSLSVPIVHGRVDRTLLAAARSAA